MIHKSKGYFSTLKSTAVDYVILDNDTYSTILVDTTAADVIISLPASANNVGRQITIKKVSSDVNVVRIVGTIDGITDCYLFDKGESVSVDSLITEWGIVNSHLHEESGTTAEFNYDSIPNRYIIEDGRALDGTANPKYARLFTKIGIVFGGATIANFKIPDSRCRVAVCKDISQGGFKGLLSVAGCGIDGKTIGAVVGTETHTLTAAQTGIPAHPHTNTIGLSGGVLNGAHNHSVIASGDNGQIWLSGGGGAGYEMSDSALGSNAVITSTDAHGHGNSFAITGGVTSHAGSAATLHQNTQPAIIKVKAIKL